MEDASIKRIGLLVGGIVAVGFGLYEAFCGLVLGHVTLFSESTTLAGTDTHGTTFTGVGARVVGSVFFLLALAVAYGTIRRVRESS